MPSAPVAHPDPGHLIVVSPRMTQALAREFLSELNATPLSQCEFDLVA
jgi:hypothetical protein